MILIIIIIVIIISYLLLVSRNKMWDNLPVSNKKMKNEGYITNNFNVQIDTSKYNIYVFSPNQSVNHLISFINENSNLLTNINNDVDIELFRYETINSDSFINNYLSLYHKKKIIGTLVNTPYDLFFYNTIVNTNKIKFLVIHNDYNYNNIYSILFNYNIQKNIYGKYKTFLMEKDKMKYPFNYICKSRYYTYDLYNISKNSNYTNIRMYKQDNNLNKYFDFYNRKSQKERIAKAKNFINKYLNKFGNSIPSKYIPSKYIPSIPSFSNPLNTDLFKIPKIIYQLPFKTLSSLDINFNNIKLKEEIEKIINNKELKDNDKKKEIMKILSNHLYNNSIDIKGKPISLSTFFNKYLVIIITIILIWKFDVYNKLFPYNTDTEKGIEFDDLPEETIDRIINTIYDKEELLIDLLDISDENINRYLDDDTLKTIEEIL